MAANMWKNSLKNVESDNNKILYETLLDFLQRNRTYYVNKHRIKTVLNKLRVKNLVMQHFIFHNYMLKIQHSCSKVHILAVKLSATKEHRPEQYITT